MSFIELPYGRSGVACDYEEPRFEVLAHDIDENVVVPMNDAEIDAAIDSPIDAPNLEDIIDAQETVLIVVPDATRASGSGQIVNVLVRKLVQAGIAPGNMQAIFATGIHRAVTVDEKRELLTPFIFQRIRTLDHNASNESQIENFGDTERGTPIELNRALSAFDHVITIGGVGFHYFAGFSGGRKLICPGLASARTIAATHLLALDFDKDDVPHRRAGVGTGRLFGNPVHEEMERVAAVVAPSFSINTIADGRGRVLAIYAGDWRASHRRACAEYAESFTIPIEAKRDVVVVSAGGFPRDINLIQAHKALDAAAHACTEGGTLILVAECAEGLGRADFLKWFDEPNAASLANRLRAEYEVNGQTAWALMSKCERFKVFLISNLADEDVRYMRMIPARSVAEALAQKTSSSPNEFMHNGFIMPRGAEFLPTLSAKGDNDAQRE